MKKIEVWNYASLHVNIRGESSEEARNLLLGVLKVAKGCRVKVNGRGNDEVFIPAYGRTFEGTPKQLILFTQKLKNLKI